MDDIKIEGNGKAFLYGNKITKIIESNNYYILCTSKYNSVVSEFEGYDNCYEIISPESFYYEITIALNKIIPVKFLGCFEVTYKNRIENWEHSRERIHPALIKEIEYEQQGEIRAIWEPLDKKASIEPIINTSINIGKYMKYIPLK